MVENVACGYLPPNSVVVRTTKMDDDGGGRDEANDDVSFLHCKE